MQISFKALEYTADDSFEPAEYEYEGDSANGWTIKRNGSAYLTLGKGYELLKTRLCGVCSTDIARRFLPFPLPQITGHELVAESLDGKNRYVVEINDTPVARGDEHLGIFGMAGIHTHTPDRMVLGIDRLPGGFGPYILAPKNAMVAFQDIPDRTAVMIEPFAAALQAVIASPPKNGYRVAVLGPRRLGSLVIAALKAYKESNKIDYTITALARHESLLDLSKKLGADEAINISSIPENELNKQFDIVYDTTSTEAGFNSALSFAKKEVHLKSTNGQPMAGFSELTELVVDELSILPLSVENLAFKWRNENRINERILVIGNLDNKEQILNEYVLKSGAQVYRVNHGEAETLLLSGEFTNRLPRFDIGIADSVENIDLLIRPNENHENSLIRPRGAILFSGSGQGNKLLEFIESGGALRTSRCGDFHLSLRLLSENKALAEEIAKNMITHVYSSKELEQAFISAKDSKAVKVIVEHE